MKRTVVITCLVLIAGTSFAQKKNSPATLTALTDSIHAIVQRQHIPGLMVGITTRDSVLFSGGFGYADVEAKRPVTGQTLFRMGSVTKMFVSLSILKLVEAGKLSLQDELKKVVPEVPFQNQWEAAHPVRIIHLLEHTAGFDDMKLNRMCSQDTIAYAGKEAMLLQQPSLVSRWAPGERMAYSNPGYVVLGYIIEKLTGSSYDEYINTQVLQPLGMHASNFNLWSRFPDKDVKEYVVHSGMVNKVPSVTCLMGAAGALWSCPDDMVKFVRFFLKQGDSVFTVNSIREMETMHSSLAAEAGLTSGYGLGNAQLFIYKKYPWRGHGGWMGTCFSTCAYNRELGVGFVCSSNGNQSNGAIERLIMDYFEKTYPGKKTATVAMDLKTITPYAGQYQFESPRNEIASFNDKLLGTPRVYLENNSLYVKFFPVGMVKLVQTAPFIFTKEGANSATVIFTTNKEGKRVMVMDGAYFEQASLGRVAVTRWLAIIAVLLAAIAVVAGLVSLVGYAAGKVKLRQLPVRVLPLVAVALLVWAVISLLQVQTESYLLSELQHVSGRSVVVFAGTLLFGIFSLLYLLLVVSRLRQVRPYWLTTYRMATALSLCYITFALFQHGWIGLRTWAM